MKNRQNTKALSLLSAGIAAVLLSIASTGAHAQVAQSTVTTMKAQDLGHIQSVKPLNRDSATLYKQVLPGGRVVYTDQPVQGHGIAKVITVDLRSTSTWSAQTDMSTPGNGATANSGNSGYAAPVASERAQLVAQNMSSRGMEIGAAAGSLEAAEARFMAASAAKQTVETPQPGERSANVNGTSRLNAAYWERQQKVAEEFKAANAAYDAALTAARNAK